MAVSSLDFCVCKTRLEGKVCTDLVGFGLDDCATADGLADFFVFLWVCVAVEGGGFAVHTLCAVGIAGLEFVYLHSVSGHGECTRVSSSDKEDIFSEGDFAAVEGGGGTGGAVGQFGVVGAAAGVVWASTFVANCVCAYRFALYCIDGIVCGFFGSIAVLQDTGFKSLGAVFDVFWNMGDPSVFYQNGVAETD